MCSVSSVLSFPFFYSLALPKHSIHPRRGSLKHSMHPRRGSLKHSMHPRRGSRRLREMQCVVFRPSRLVLSCLVFLSLALPKHSMHPRQGSQGCAGLFCLSCAAFRLSRTVLFCRPSVLHCLVSFVLQCTRHGLQMTLLRSFLRGPLH